MASGVGSRKFPVPFETKEWQLNKFPIQKTVIGNWLLGPNQVMLELPITEFNCPSYLIADRKLILSWLPPIGQFYEALIPIGGWGALAKLIGFVQSPT